MRGDYNVRGEFFLIGFGLGGGKGRGGVVGDIIYGNGARIGSLCLFFFLLGGGWVGDGKRVGRLSGCF